MQVILPHSHASKQVTDKYAKAHAIHAAARAVAEARHKQATNHCPDDAATASQHSVSSASGSGSSASHCGSIDSDQLNMTLEEAEWELQEAKQPGTSPLHAYHPGVVLLQVSHITIAAPADAALLRQAHSDVAGDLQQHVGRPPPLWMQDTAAVQQLLSGSQAIIQSSGAPAAATAAAAAEPAAEAGLASSSSVPAAAGPSAAAGSSPVPAEAGVQQQSAPMQPQVHGSSSGGSHSAQYTAGRRQQPAAVVRHGVLMVPEAAAGPDSQAGDAAAGLPSFSLTTAASRLWKQMAAKVAPLRRRRLVIRPGEEMLQGTGVAAGAGDGPAGRPAAAGAPAGAGQAGAAAAAVAGAAVDEELPAAHCLIDLHGLELFAGRMVREQDMPSVVSASARAKEDAVNRQRSGMGVFNVAVASCSTKHYLQRLNRLYHVMHAATIDVASYPIAALHYAAFCRMALHLLLRCLRSGQQMRPMAGSGGAP